MAEHLGILVISLIALAKGADLVVEYSARVARRFGVSDLVVGLAITSVGTSLPELASSLAAAVAGSSGLVVGNVVGSNIANIGLVLGAAALIRPFSTDARMHDRDGFILVATAALFFAAVLDNRIGRVDAAAFVVLYVAYVAFVVRTDRAGVEHRFKDFLRFVFDFEYAAPAARSLARHVHLPGRGGESEAASPSGSVPPDRRGMAREVGIAVAALAALIAGAHGLVAGAIRIAGLLGVPENLLGISLVAVGTSVPELLVAVSAARSGRAEMVVGNVLGSNIANVLLIVGAAGLVRPLSVSELSVVYTIPIMLFFSIGLLYLIRSDWHVGRGQGALALAAYGAFLALAFVQGWG